MLLKIYYYYTDLELSLVPYKLLINENLMYFLRKKIFIVNNKINIDKIQIIVIYNIHNLVQ